MVGKLFLQINLHLYGTRHRIARVLSSCYKFNKRTSLSHMIGSGETNCNAIINERFVEAILTDRNRRLWSEFGLSAVAE